jgi:polyhydroxybutyrate depolymerase
MISTGKLIVEGLLAAIILFVGSVLYYLCGHGEEAARAHLLRQRSEKDGNVSEDREHFLTHGGRRRRYVVHVPKGVDPTRPLPVVLGFHGGLGHAESFRALSRLNEAADRHEFLAVYPDGTGRGKMLTFNAGACCGYALDHKVDDVGFTRLVLDDLSNHYRVDSQRVYATGMSNGAMLCYRLACELSDRIAAIGPVAATMQCDGPPPARPVPVIHFHGRKDPVAFYQGGKTRFGLVTHRAVTDTIAWWVKVNHCQEQPVESKETRDYLCQRYAPAAGTKGAPVVLYTLLEGGHTWPGGVDLTAHLGTGKLIASVDADALMWQFFERFSLADPATELPE